MEFVRRSAFSTAIDRAERRAGISPATARTVLVLGMVVGAAAGLWIGNGPDSAEAVRTAGAEFTRLLRAMAGLKALMAAGAAAAIWWRLGTLARPAWLAGYTAAAAAMVAGVPLIWGMVHVGAGALALHAGLLASVLLLWRDPAVGQRLATLIAARRSNLAAHRR